jgi:hypothetical protein
MTTTVTVPIASVSVVTMTAVTLAATIFPVAVMPVTVAMVIVMVVIVVPGKTEEQTTHQTIGVIIIVIMGLCRGCSEH